MPMPTPSASASAVAESAPATVWTYSALSNTPPSPVSGGAPAAARPPPLTTRAASLRASRRMSGFIDLKAVPEGPIVLDPEYLFSAPDSPDNLVLANADTSAAASVPVIRYEEPRRRPSVVI